MQKADILVKNGIVLTMDDNNRSIPDGWVAISGEDILAVGSSDAIPAWESVDVIDAQGGIVMPGLVNTHTHAAMTCFRGLADDLPLMAWLNDHIFPAESKLNIGKVYSGAALACAEMILSGTTCFCDMYLFEDAVAQAAKDAGMRAVVGEVLYDFDSPNYGPIEKGFAYTEALVSKWKDDPLIKIAIEPHSAYLCEPELLKTASALSRKHNILMVIHLAESQSEVSEIQKRYGQSPVEHLADLEILAPNLLACHCVVLTQKDIKLLSQFDVKVAHNPESNMKLASGVAPIPELLESGVCVGLGTDGCASNNNLDLFLEMDTVAKLHKAQTLDPTVLDSETVLRMATIQGARALGLGSSCGSLEPGKKADLIIIDTHQPHLTPMYHPASHMVYAARGSDVRTTMINGRVVMENRKLVSMDLDKIMADVDRIAEEIKN